MSTNRKIFLETERVILTEVSRSDIPFLLDLDSDPDVMKYISDGKPSTLEDVTAGMDRILKVIEKSQYKFGFWFAYTKENNEFMGWFHFRPCKSTPDDEKNIELGYRLKKKFWGKGYATEVSKQLIKLGFEQYGIDSVFAVTMKANLASQKVMQKLGLKYVGDYVEENFPGPNKIAVRFQMSKYKILGVFTGKVTKLYNDVESGIIKHPASVLEIKKHAIHNDEVANLNYHGGEMRVIHHYSLKNYNFLKSTFPDIAERFVPGSFGENIVTEELTENELNIGDIYQLGTAKVQITVSRRPCATINYAYKDSRILKEVMQTGHTGWFYRVLEEGEVRVGDYLEFLERPFPNMPVSKLYNQGYGENKFSDLDFLKRCLDTGLMDKGWKPKLEAVFSSK